VFYRVVKVSTRRELKDFINLPFEIYKEDKNWIAPIKSELIRILDVKKNPYFNVASLDLFNCYLGEKIISRISLSVNKIFCEKTGTRTGFWGFFESYNDSQAVSILLKTLSEFCLQRNIKRIEGPFNPNLYSELGILSNKFNSPPSFFQIYNPEYYNLLLKENGFRILEVLHTRINRDSNVYLNSKFSKAPDIELKDLKVRSFSNKNTEADLEHLRNIFNDAFSDNWHFTSVSREEYLFASKHLKLVTPPDLIKFVEYKGEPVAAVHLALNINPLLKKFRGKKSLINFLNFLIRKRKIDRAIIFAVGIKKDFRNSRVVHLLFNATVEATRKFKVLETTWMYDENKIVISLAEKLGLEKDKEFFIYYKDLSI
jgi:hypothetical protein